MDRKPLNVRLYSLFKCLFPWNNGTETPRLCDDNQQEDFERVYRRAQTVSQRYGFTLDDFVYLTDKFWDFHLDKTVAEGIPVHILITIQYNLAFRTILQAVRFDERYQPLLKKILAFEISAQFMLTEIDHGLDAKHLGTTATLQSDGSFILNTPYPGSAKFMPPSMPVAGLPRVAVVMAKLIVKEEVRGVRPFLVALSDEKEMCRGVATKLIPPLGGGDSLDHAITSFDDVYLPPSALLGDIKPPTNHQEHFFSVISRVPIGTLSLSIGLLPAQKASTVIYAQYSMRRMITDPRGHKVPFISFRTQQLPLLRSLAQIRVLEKMAPWVIERFRTPTTDARVRHGLAIITKAVFLQHGQQTLAQFVERCGAQGLFAHNQLVSYQSQMRWVSISEGDTLALSIRLATELVLGKYTLPAPTMPTCLLAKHEQGLIAEAMAQLQTLKGGHRSKDYNDFMIPRCRPIVEAIGHRVAYEAACAAGVPECILTVYECEVVKMDIGWYIENGEVTRSSLWEKENAALNEVLASAETMIQDMGAGIRTTAPIVSQEKYSSFVDSLPSLSGEASYSLQTE